jgi:hypothetical protein
VDEAGWGAQLARLAAYKAAHGDCNVPQCWAKDLKLGRWVSDQRAFKRKLDHGEPSKGMTAERAARLTALGLVWELGHKGGGTRPNNKEWEAQLARLVAYMAENGGCNVPKHWAEDPRLGKWVNNQRQYKRQLDRGEASGGMTPERAARLTALNFVWEPNNEEWEAQLARLVAHKAAHGDSNVPQCWAKDLKLGRWVGDQRAFKRKVDRGEASGGMTAERMARLTALNFVWEPGTRKRSQVGGAARAAGGLQGGTHRSQRAEGLPRRPAAPRMSPQAADSQAAARLRVRGSADALKVLPP